MDSEQCMATKLQSPAEAKRPLCRCRWVDEWYSTLVWLLFEQAQTLAVKTLKKLFLAD